MDICTIVMRVNVWSRNLVQIPCHKLVWKRNKFVFHQTLGHNTSHLEVHLHLSNMHLTLGILSGTDMGLEKMQLDSKELALGCDLWSCCNSKGSIVVFKHIRMALNPHIILASYHFGNNFHKLLQREHVYHGSREGHILSHHCENRHFGLELENPHERAVGQSEDVASPRLSQQRILRVFRTPQSTEVSINITINLPIVLGTHHKALVSSSFEIPNDTLGRNCTRLLRFIGELCHLVDGKSNVWPGVAS